MYIYVTLNADERYTEELCHTEVELCQQMDI